MRKIKGNTIPSNAEEAVKRKLAPAVGRETIRILLESHDLKPWRKKMWCIAELDEEYIACMEDVLAVYEQPSSEGEPVVCVDEKPVVLLMPRSLVQQEVRTQDLDLDDNEAIELLARISGELVGNVGSPAKSKNARVAGLLRQKPGMQLFFFRKTSAAANCPISRTV